MFQTEHRARWAEPPRRAGTRVALRTDVTWLFWLILAVVIAAVAAVTGLQPAGGRPVAHTRMMSMGRLMFALLVIIIAYVAYRAYGGS